MRKLIGLIDELFGGAAVKPKLTEPAALRAAIATRAKALSDLETEPHPPDNVREIVAREKVALAELSAELAKLEYWDRLCATAPLPTKAQIKAVGYESGFDVPADVRKQLEDLQAVYDKDMAALLEFLPRKARESHRANEQSLTEKILAGENPNDIEGWTLEDFEEDYHGKVVAYKSALKRHGQAAFDLMLPHLETYCQFATEFADQKEENEKSLHAVFHMAHRPSDVQLLVRKCVSVVEARTKFQSMGNPPNRIADIIL